MYNEPRRRRDWLEPYRQRNAPAAPAPAAAADPTAPAAASSSSTSLPSRRATMLFRETTEGRKFRKEVMAHFRCPFREEGTCIHEENPNKCLFAHPQRVPDGILVPKKDTATTTQVVVEQKPTTSKAQPVQDGDLKEIPSYVCIYSLINSCRNHNVFHQIRVRSVQSAPAPGDASRPTMKPQTPTAIGRNACTSGLHLKPEDMVDLEHFEVQYFSIIEDFYGADRDRECGICFEKVLAKKIPKNRRFGMLAKCTHVFCAPCLKEWRTRSANCPVCREPSEKFAIRARWIEDPALKEKTFIQEKPDAHSRLRRGGGGGGVGVAGGLEGWIADVELDDDERVMAQQLLELGNANLIHLDRGNNIMIVPAGYDPDDDMVDMVDAYGGDEDWGGRHSDEDDEDSLSGHSMFDDYEAVFGHQVDFGDHDDADLDWEAERFDDFERGFGGMDLVEDGFDWRLQDAAAEDDAPPAGGAAARQGQADRSRDNVIEHWQGNRAARGGGRGRRGGRGGQQQPEDGGGGLVIHFEATINRPNRGRRGRRGGHGQQQQQQQALDRDGPAPNQNRGRQDRGGPARAHNHNRGGLRRRAQVLEPNILPAEFGFRFFEGAVNIRGGGGGAGGRRRGAHGAQDPPRRAQEPNRARGGRADGGNRGAANRGGGGGQADAFNGRGYAARRGRFPW